MTTSFTTAIRPRWVTPDGAIRCGVQNVDWIVTRGVLLDIAALMGVNRLENDYAVTGDDLDAAARATGIDIRQGRRSPVPHGLVHALP